MRALSEEQASACENAVGGRCRCRCGGALHGAARGVALHELPEDDPHYRTAERQERRSTMSERREAEQQERIEELERALEERAIVLRQLLDAARGYLRQLDVSGSATDARPEDSLPEDSPLRLAMASARLELLGA